MTTTSKLSNLEYRQKMEEAEKAFNLLLTLDGDDLLPMLTGLIQRHPNLSEWRLVHQPDS